MAPAVQQPTQFPVSLPRTYSSSLFGFLWWWGTWCPQGGLSIPWLLLTFLQTRRPLTSANKNLSSSLHSTLSLASTTPPGALGCPRGSEPDPWNRLETLKWFQAGVDIPGFEFFKSVSGYSGEWVGVTGVGTPKQWGAPAEFRGAVRWRGVWVGRVGTNWQTAIPRSHVFNTLAHFRRGHPSFLTKCSFGESSHVAWTGCLVFPLELRLSYSFTSN